MPSSSPIKKTGSVQHMDPIWHAVRSEAEETIRREPLLATFLYSTILNHQSLEEAVIHRISQRLDHPDMESELLRQTFTAMVEATPCLVADPARRYPGCLRSRPGLRRVSWSPMLYFKGFQAIQTHRPGPLAVEGRAREISRSTCKAAPRRSSRPISTRRFPWDRECSSTTPPVSSSA